MTHPMLRTWAIIAAVVAFVAMLRGAWMLALACFLFSPAPVWLFSRGESRLDRLSLVWIGGGVAVVAAGLALVLLAAYTGGVPQVHEWREAIRASMR